MMTSLTSGTKAVPNRAVRDGYTQSNMSAPRAEQTYKDILKIRKAVPAHVGLEYSAYHEIQRVSNTHHISWLIRGQCGGTMCDNFTKSFLLFSTRQPSDGISRKMCIACFHAYGDSQTQRPSSFNEARGYLESPYL